MNTEQKETFLRINKREKILTRDGGRLERLADLSAELIQTRRNELNAALRQLDSERAALYRELTTEVMQKIFNYLTTFEPSSAPVSFTFPELEDALGLGSYPIKVLAEVRYRLDSNQIEWAKLMPTYFFDLEEIKKIAEEVGFDE
ncbi:MAG: hypothetical protein ACRC8U_10385 [Brooklawnia sp.]